MNTVIVEHEVILVTQECINCGVVFGVTQEFDARRRRDKQAFCCPNGHRQSYIQSPEDRLKQQLEDERRKLSNAQFELMAAEKKVRRLEKRVKNGICPCCHRQFANVARHMAGQHPDFGSDPTPRAAR